MQIRAWSRQGESLVQVQLMLGSSPGILGDLAETLSLMSQRWWSARNECVIRKHIHRFLPSPVNLLPGPFLYI